MRTAAEINAERRNQAGCRSAFWERRNESRLSQRDVAKECGLTHTAIKRYESGTSTPNIKTAYVLANFFDCTVYDLFPDDSDEG